VNRPRRSVDDGLVNLGLIAIAAVGALAAILRLAGAVAAWVSGSPQPAGGLASGLRVLGSPGDPARALDAPDLHPVVYWLVLVLLLAATFVATLVVWRRLTTYKHRASRDPRRLAGVASAGDVRVGASEKALLARAKTLRPSLSKPAASQVGYYLGRSRGKASGHRWRTRCSSSGRPDPARACTS
jgi:type IV secretion system protein VirD4